MLLVGLQYHCIFLHQARDSASAVAEIYSKFHTPSGCGLHKQSPRRARTMLLKPDPQTGASREVGGDVSSVLLQQTSKIR